LEGFVVSVEVFDPAMCCSTGVCGPSVDPALVRFAADLDWLAGQGIEVTRATLSQEPAKFVACEPVRDALAVRGESALPAVLVTGELRSTGRYPDRAELAEWVGIAAPPSEPMAVLVPAGVAELPQADSCCGDGGCC
jgi:hypothetical protein